jgi:hypothetical protein
MGVWIMSSKNLVGKCGLFCGACSIYRAERDSEDWRTRIAEKSNCSVDKVRCNGCGDLTSECWGKGCKIVLCTQTRGYNFCYECPEYESNNCSKYDSLSKRYISVGVDLRENLRRIKEGKIDEWLLQSEELFRCTACDKPISAWSSECHRCGSKLK